MNDIGYCEICASSWIEIVVSCMINDVQKVSPPKNGQLASQFGIGLLEPELLAAMKAISV